MSTKEEKNLTLFEKQNSELPVEVQGVFDIGENMEGVAPRFPQIKIIHQGQQFEMPDETKTDTIEGVILDTNRINAWWQVSFDESGGGTPPDCFSLDGIKPGPGCSAQQSTSCRECEKNAFGSDGRGKACKNMKRVHILLDGEMLPYRLTLPPSSLKAIDDYISMMTSKGLPYQLLRTRFGLKKTKNRDGIIYSEIAPVKVGVIEDADKAHELKRMLDYWKPACRGQEILFDEYGGIDAEIE